MSAPGIFRPPTPVNEPVHSYAPGTPEREELRVRLAQMERERISIPMVIGGKEVETKETTQAVMPHRKEHVLADVAKGGPEHVQLAIDAAREAHADWSRLPWEERASVYLRAAELLAGPWRSTLVAATMLNQSKTAHQAEIDAAAELVDFWRFNVEFMLRIYSEQPASSPGVWNRMEYRPLEGFVFAVSPFNFTAIGGNLSGSPALMGNTVVWKPASSAALSAHYTLQLLREAGLPDGVINLVYGSGATIGDAALASPELAGIHFTGSTPVFQSMWKTVGANIANYRNYPRIVGETGGKDFIIAHSERGRRRGRDGNRPRLLRVPGPEVLRRLTRLRAEEHVAGAEGAPHRAGRGAADGRRRRLLELHGRGDRQQLLQDAEGSHRRSPSLRHRPRSWSAATTTTARASS